MSPQVYIFHAASGDIIDIDASKSSGHFYALVSSISVKCADPQSPSANITSYVYGTNGTTYTPNVAFSNQSTLINGADLVGATYTHARNALAITVGLVLFLQVV